MAAKPIATFSERLNEIMSIRGKRQVDLCRDLHLSKSTVSQYMTGVSTPKTDRTYLMAQYLHCDPVWLSGYDVPMEKKEHESLVIDIGGMNADQISRIKSYIEQVKEGNL